MSMAIIPFISIPFGPWVTQILFTHARQSCSSKKENSSRSFEISIRNFRSNTISASHDLTLRVDKATYILQEMEVIGEIPYKPFIDTQTRPRRINMAPC